jgi:hypothetical protein
MPDVSVAMGTITRMNGPAIGSEALASGSLTRGQLRWNYRPIFRDVYLPKSMRPSSKVMTLSAWLWAGRRAVITGRAAAALHGAEWVDEYAPVELLWENSHYPPGTIVRQERFQHHELTAVDGLTVATPARTGFDLARHLPRTMAVAHLDALARATGITDEDVLPLLVRYTGARGNKPVRTTVSLMDAGAQSPKESWLRLVVIDAGLPPADHPDPGSAMATSRRTSTWAGNSRWCRMPRNFNATSIARTGDDT